VRLYSGIAERFVLEVQRNQIAQTLEDAFFDYYRYRPHRSEVVSWRNSLSAMAHALNLGRLKRQGIILEYELPLSSKRLDCLVCGVDKVGESRAVIVELKQWETCASSDIDKVVVWLGGGKRVVLHPSVQVNQYQQYLEDSHTAFHEGPSPVGLSSCAYLHNYRFADDDPIRDKKFEEVLTASPIFSAAEADGVAAFLAERVGAGHGLSVLRRIDEGKYRPSRKLMMHVAETVKSKPPWVLIDEQLVVFENVLSAVKKRLKDGRKQVILIRGGPGTGKSVIAINLLAELLRKEFACHYATGSKAFTETLWKVVGRGARSMFKYFNSYAHAQPNAIDVLICDESHRIRETSASRFTPQARRTGLPQVRELLEAARITVFFIDDKQVVRPNEIGSTTYIKKEAIALGAELSEFQLEVQFRCAGSAGFVNWINNTLGIERNANVLWDGSENFEFKIFPSPQALEDAIRTRAAEGQTARVSAGFCWKWSEPRADGTLVDDVVIGDYRRPWDAKPGSNNLAPGIPSASLWATEPAGIDQIGCVYNIQGFELDYVGVIWGEDLVYRFDKNEWIGDRTKSADNVVKRSEAAFVDLVKNTYRVLLSRGMKGCYVHFMDKETEQFVRSRLEVRSTASRKAAEPPADYTVD
jgi:DUF2075 family protein